MSLQYIAFGGESSDAMRLDDKLSISIAMRAHLQERGITPDRIDIEHIDYRKRFVAMDFILHVDGLYYPYTVAVPHGERLNERLARAAAAHVAKTSFKI